MIKDLKQVYVCRTVKGILAAGLRVGKVEVDINGRIIVFTLPANDNLIEINEWDDALK